MRINLIEFFKRDIKDSGCDKGVIKFEKYGLIVGDGFENDIDYFGEYLKLLRIEVKVIVVENRYIVDGIVVYSICVKRVEAESVDDLYFLLFDLLPAEFIEGYFSEYKIQRELFDFYKFDGQKEGGDENEVEFVTVFQLFFR